MDKSKLLIKGKFGIEKENLRVNQDGKLAISKHPDIFGKDNQYITTDFSESQIEMITPPCDTIKQSVDFLSNLHNIVSTSLEGEYLWTQSNPPILPNEEDIPLSNEEDINKREYIEYLSLKYGRKRSVLSGIHFNFSFSNDLIDYWYKQQSESINIDEFSDNLYIKVTKYMMKYRWLFVYLFGASPVFHKTYMQKCVDKSDNDTNGDCLISGMQSLRNSKCGYRNEELYFINYKSLKDYNESINDLINNNKIKKISELYNAVRLKQNEDSTHINYLELRFLDLNPLFPVGINIKDLELIHLFIIFFAQKDDFDYNYQLQLDAQINQDNAAQSINAMIKDNNNYNSIYTIALPLLNQLEAFFDEIEFNEYDYKELLLTAKKRILKPESTYSSLIKEEIKETNYIEFHIKKAKKYLDQSLSNSYQLYGYEDMELSTQILLKSALKFGLNVEILDRSTNFIRLSDLHRKKIEYIKEATKTSLDKYSQVLAMENKLITKQILFENNITVPIGYIIETVEEGIDLLKLNKLPTQLVIKPNNSNFGKGITIFNNGYNEQELIKAIQYALKEDSTILLEQFISGKEYRFLVIDNEVVGVLHRRAANVVGDGNSTIKQLVEEKNKDSLRCKGYKTPLEYLNLGEIEIQFLKEQGLNIDSIPKMGERIYLRENSNISTGGDSIDFADEVHESYKQIALEAALALDVKISGIDMMIDDINVPATQMNYAIIELNFNPAIHIHCYPYRGKNRSIGDKIIKLLFKDNKKG